MVIYDEGDYLARQELGLHPMRKRSVKMNALRSKLVAQMGRGNPRQREALLKHIQYSEVPALEEFFGTPGTNLSKTMAKRLMRSRGQDRFKENKKIVAEFENLPSNRQFFISIVGSMEANVIDADTACEQFASTLSQWFRKRFPHCKVAVFVEADLVKVEAQPASILPDTRWKANIPAGTVMWKVHAHILAYLPFIPFYDGSDNDAWIADVGEAVKHSLQHQVSGKRNWLNGARQVDVQPMGTALKDVTPKSGWIGPNEYVERRSKKKEYATVPNAAKRVGYSNKGHWKAPLPEDPFLGLTDWAWITARNLTMASRRRKVGFRKPTMIYCPDCQKFVEYDPEKNHCCWFETFSMLEWLDFSPDDFRPEVPNKEIQDNDLSANPHTGRIKPKSSDLLSCWNHGVAQGFRSLARVLGVAARTVANLLRDYCAWPQGP
jgi:hypothetical protein